MREIDLHVHTNISDGSESPEETVRYANSLGLSAIAITDHDTVGGVIRAQTEGQKLGIEVVSGIEFCCGWAEKEIHILGYDIDTENEKLKNALSHLIIDRDERNEKMAARMRADGIRVDMDELRMRYPDSVIGRPHMAICLIEQGLADSVTDAFRRYLNPGMKYYIRRNFISVGRAAELIRNAGGKAVVAHPGQYKLDDERMEQLMRDAKAASVSGLECCYSGYSVEESTKYLKLAEKFGFCPTAGSDWHGKNKPHIKLGSGINGELSASYGLLQGLRSHG